MQLPANILFTKNPDQSLTRTIEELKPDKVGVLVDENTKTHCLPKVKSLQGAVLIEVKSGEAEKNISTCEHIWQMLTESQFSRKSLLVNLGGGVIGDMGGFAAATYKRGIRFVNMPTTLLSQVDASIGGKLGIDFHGLKNHIGVFQDPDRVILWDGFLKTLPDRQLRSGYAEVLKHGLIWDRDYWQKCGQFPEKVDWEYVLRRSVEIKGEVVTEDPKENGLRKILNFGHTLGHAVETWHLDSGRDILHGEAIAAGMIMEGELALLNGKLEKAELTEMTGVLDSIFPRINELPNVDSLMKLMGQDKKNEGGNIMFSLIDRIGHCQFDVKVSTSQIKKAVEQYQGSR